MTKAEMQSEAHAHHEHAPHPGLTWPRPASAAACGKTIIVGEHAVVYGARAVAMPVHTMQMGVKLTPTGATGKHGEPLVRVLLGGRSVSDHLRGVIDEAFTVLDVRPFAMDLEGNSTVLIGAGLGSSASLCIVVLRAIAEATGRTLTRTELAAGGNRLEKRFHGNPSGLDTCVVAMEQVISFVKGQGPTPVTVAPAAGRPWRFALLDSGARSSTMAMIQVAAPYFQGAEGELRVERFDALADAVGTGLATGSPGMVAEAMQEANRHLATAGVVSTPMADLILAALGVGVLAAKVTGAGGGGCVLALLDPEHADRQLESLKRRIGGTRVFGVELP